MQILLCTHPTDEHWDRTAHGIVDLDVELARLILSRRRALLTARKVDPDYAESHYVDGVVRYFDDLEVEDLLPEDVLEGFWDTGWAVVPPGLDLSRFTKSRTESERLVIGANYFHWACWPKNVAVQVLTEMLSYDALQALL